jgi:hypothetical protein
LRFAVPTNGPISGRVERYSFSSGSVGFGAEGGGRFHIIVDMNKDHGQDLDLESMPYEIWRVSKNSKENP